MNFENSLSFVRFPTLCLLEFCYNSINGTKQQTHRGENKMTLAEIFETLHNAGYITTVNTQHTQVTISLSNRSVNTMEVWATLEWQIDRSRMNRIGDTVVITE
jgi:hypothetical protein